MFKCKLSKSIQNRGHDKYLDWIISGDKIYEGRLQSKIVEWDLKIGDLIHLYNQDNNDNWVIIQVIELLKFDDFDKAFLSLGNKLIPNKTSNEVINMYNILFYYHDEVLEDSVTSKMIADNKVVAIGFVVKQYRK